MNFEELSLLIEQQLDPSSMVARLFELNGFGGGDRSNDLMVVAGRQRYGSVLSPSLGSRLIAEGMPEEPNTLSLDIGDREAVASGLACGGSVRVMVHPWAWLPDIRPHVGARRPFALVTALDAQSRPIGIQVATIDLPGDGPGTQQAAELLARGRAGVSVLDSEQLTLHIHCFIPSSRLVVIGGGVLAKALQIQGDLLGIEVTQLEQGEKPPLVGRSDGVVVLDHDHDHVTPVLHHILQDTEVSYVGSLGSRGTQEERRRRLLECNCVEHLGRVYGPAGLDIGSRSTAETSVAIIAEMISVLRGRSAASLRAVQGPING
ncbi:XdhC family protein [Ferrimicrobium acidiphilum]|uniref:XdhC family protein n=1 Tax=Ferrimicrobium acidiphilum TaxID=121039 RepID=UPI0023F1FDF3|nr:XdhC family protein [Ferrimicrobium acidiphilum]